MSNKEKEEWEYRFEREIFEWMAYVSQKNITSPKNTTMQLCKKENGEYYFKEVMV